MVPQNARSMLEPHAVVARLKGTFAYVESSEEAGQIHVGELIESFQKLRNSGAPPVDNDYIERLKRVQKNSVYVIFGENPGCETSILDTMVIPGDPLVFDYSSPEHEKATWPLLRRCAAALGYEVVEA